MSKRAQQPGTEADQILAQNIEDEKELLETVEERIDDLADEKYHYSLDILHTDTHSVRIGVYGIEGYDLPSRRTVADAVAEQFGWTSAFEEGESTKDHYHMRVLDWEDDSETLY